MSRLFTLRGGSQAKSYIPRVQYVNVYIEWSGMVRNWAWCFREFPSLVGRGQRAEVARASSTSGIRSLGRQIVRIHSLHLLTPPWQGQVFDV
jgi:hypothetical protein